MNANHSAPLSSRGVIVNEQRLRQTLAFRSLLGVFPRNITPTDVDFCVEIGSRFLVGEFKRAGNEVPRGQRMAIERLLRKLGDGSIAFVAQHTTDCESLIDAASCTVVEWFTPNQPYWQRPDHPITVAELSSQWVSEL